MDAVDDPFEVNGGALAARYKKRQADRARREGYFAQPENRFIAT
jgi:hypothetical protein